MKNNILQIVLFVFYFVCVCFVFVSVKKKKIKKTAEQRLHFSIFVLVLKSNVYI